MSKNPGEDNKLLNLKAAAKLTGYAPDYLGQLLRQGKLRGKRVYVSVAWMTTETALQEFFEKNKTRRRFSFKRAHLKPAS